MKFISIIFILSICWSCTPPKEQTLESILFNSNEDFKKVLGNPDHEVQIIYGRIVDGKLEHQTFGDTSQYFYPASTVKMLAAFAAVAYLSNQNGMTLDATVRIDSTKYYPSEVYDSLFAGPIQIRNLIKKIFVYSDNQAYNTLYRMLGKDYINELFASIDLSTRVIHQLSEVGYSFSPESNNLSHSFELREMADSSLSLENQLYHFGGLQKFESSLNPIGQKRGRGYLDQNDSLVNEPFDFSLKNFVPLMDLLGALERVSRPDLFSNEHQFSMADDLRMDLLNVMTLCPRELPFPIDTLADNYVKFLIFGDKDKVKIPDNLIIRNKVGWAYGYLTDVAYIKDSTNNVEFFLAATILVNGNQIYNDGVYEYEEVGLPFLAELGRIVYQHELSLKK